MSAISTVDVTLGDVTFHLSTSGEPGSLPVLWLHGSGPGVTALTNWHGALESLSRDFYNIAPDVIGFGDSTHPDPPPQGIAAFTTLRVQTLAALLDHLGIDTVDIIGNSMGGIVGLCLALAHSQRVRRIILMGAGGAPLAPTPGLLSLILFYDNPTVEAMRALLPKFLADPAVFGDQLDRIAAERIPRATRPLTPGDLCTRGRSAAHQRHDPRHDHSAGAADPRRKRPDHPRAGQHLVRATAAQRTPTDR